MKATYNGVEISNGPITTTITDVLPLPRQGFPGNDASQSELVLFETTTETTGQIPVSISVSGGTLFFRHFWMNYTGCVQEREATNPDVPINPDDPSTFIWVTTVYPDSYYADPNTNSVESDGISNLVKDGQSWPWRQGVGTLTGDWIYPIYDGETVTFDFFVDPANVVLVPPN